MIKIEQLRDFISGNFTSATLSGKTINDEIKLELSLDSKENDMDFMHLYNIDLDIILNEPGNLLNYLLEKYLENNTIIGGQYFVNVQHHSDKIAFVIRGINNNFTIALRQECMGLLPIDFMSKIEFAKRKGIIDTLNKTDIKKIKIHNFDKFSLYKNYKTGLRKDTMEDGLFHYDALRIANNGESINPKTELELVFKVLQILIDKGDVNLESLRNIENMFKIGQYNYMVEYELNDCVKFIANTKDELIVFRNFLNEYLNNYKDEVKGNQLVLKLK